MQHANLTLSEFTLRLRNYNGTTAVRRETVLFFVHQTGVPIVNGRVSSEHIATVYRAIVAEQDIESGVAYAEGRA